MGYRVGLNCFGNIETANDYVLSQIARHYGERKIIAPEKVGKTGFERRKNNAPILNAR